MDVARERVKTSSRAVAMICEERTLTSALIARSTRDGMEVAMAIVWNATGQVKNKRHESSSNKRRSGGGLSRYPM